jgi:hypothetical protein
MGACAELRAATARILDAVTVCAVDEDCRIVDKTELGASVSPCAQNPTSAIFCPFAARRDADVIAAGQQLSAFAVQAEICVTCSGQPCLSYDCARDGTSRPVCDLTVHRCRLVAVR